MLKRNSIACNLSYLLLKLRLSASDNRMTRCNRASVLSLKLSIGRRILILLRVLVLKECWLWLKLLFLICASVLLVVGFSVWGRVLASLKPFVKFGTFYV